MKKTVGLLFMLLLLSSAGATESVVLGMLVSGEVAEVRVTPGQEVAAGELLVRLDDRLFRSRVAAAEARLAAARLRRTQMAQEYERARELYERTLLSDYELQSAEVAYREAEAARREAEHALAVAQRELARTRLKAPFDARVLKVLTHVGQAVRNDFQIQPLVEVTPK